MVKLSGGGRVSGSKPELEAGRAEAETSTHKQHTHQTRDYSDIIRLIMERCHHHSDTATSGSGLTEDVSPKEVLWEQTEEPVGVAARDAAQRQANQAALDAAPRPAHHKVAPNVGLTSGCQPDQLHSPRKEDHLEKSGANSGRDDPASGLRPPPSPTKRPRDLQTPPLKERLRSSRPWKSPTPGPSHRPDGDDHSTSPSGEVELPRLNQAVRAAGLANARGWTSQASEQGSAAQPERGPTASDVSGVSKRPKPRREGGWNHKEKVGNVAEMLDVLLSSLYPASTEANPEAETSGGAPYAKQLPGGSRGKSNPRAAPQPGVSSGAVPKPRSGQTGKVSRHQTEVLKPVVVEEEIQSVSQVGKPVTKGKTQPHPRRQATANQMVEEWVQESDKASRDTDSQADQPGQPGLNAAPRKEKGHAEGPIEQKGQRSAFQRVDPRHHDPRGYAPSYGSQEVGVNPLRPPQINPEPRVGALTRARLQEKDPAISKPGPGRCQSDASTRVSCTTSKLRVIMKGLLTEVLPAVPEETKAQTAEKSVPTVPQQPTGGPEGDLRHVAANPVRTEMPVPPTPAELMPPPGPYMSMFPPTEPGPCLTRAQPRRSSRAQPCPTPAGPTAPDAGLDWWRLPPTTAKPAMASSSNGLSGSAGFKPKKLRGYSGKEESWEVYQTHLDIVQRLNQWDDAAMLIHFCSELSSSALEFYGSLDWPTQQTFDGVKTAMAQRFGSMTSTESTRHQLENLRQRPDQSLQDLGQQVRRLAYHVYADDLPARREQEAVRSFMKAISSQEVIRALVGGQLIGSMSQAIELAVRAQEMNKAFLGRPKAAMIRSVRADETDKEFQDEDPDSTSQEEWVEDIRAFVAKGYPGFRGGKGFNPSKKETDKPARPCWLCQGEGHWSRDCVYAPKNWPDWLKKDVALVAQGKTPTTQVPGSLVVQAADNSTSLSPVSQVPAQVVQATTGHGTLQPQGQAIRLVTTAQPQTLVVMAEGQGQLPTSNQRGGPPWKKKKKAQAKKGQSKDAAPKTSRDNPEGGSPSVDPEGSKGKANRNQHQGNENGL